MQDGECGMQDVGCRPPVAGWLTDPASDMRYSEFISLASGIRHPAFDIRLSHDGRHTGGSGSSGRCPWFRPMAMPRTFIPLTLVPADTPGAAGSGPGTKKLKKPFTRRRPGSEQLIRQVVQLAFVLLNVWIGVRFYLFGAVLPDGRADSSVPRPPGVDGWLPIAALMNLKDRLLTGEIPKYTPRGCSCWSPSWRSRCSFEGVLQLALPGRHGLGVALERGRGALRAQPLLWRPLDVPLRGLNTFCWACSCTRWRRCPNPTSRQSSRALRGHRRREDAVLLPPHGDVGRRVRRDAVSRSQCGEEPLVPLSLPLRRAYRIARAREPFADPSGRGPLHRLREMRESLPGRPPRGPRTPASARPNARRACSASPRARPSARSTSRSRGTACFLPGCSRQPRSQSSWYSSGSHA